MDAERVHIVCDDVAQAKDWAHRNKPRALPKIYHSASEVGPRGLLLSDGTPVYVLSDTPEHVRDAWRMTGGSLVFV